MKAERELFEKHNHFQFLMPYVKWDGETYIFKESNSLEETKNYYNDYLHFIDCWSYWCASAQREGYKLVPVEPSEDQWGGLARHLVKYMQSHDRYCPKTLGKYISRSIGLKNIPDWLNKEVPNWGSDHAFATADLGVFIYKAMIGASE